MRILLGGGKQTFGLVQDRSGKPLALGTREPRKPQGSPFLSHGRGGIRPGQAFGGAEAPWQVNEPGQWRAR
jgi:hypothetical protein